ncbi:hypothetical protein NHQ30_000233 [Ciborinia camelliae]|nr:hypothetical protein NHQ30_000233 [Ciborinia camelliae]
MMHDVEHATAQTKKHKDDKNAKARERYKRKHGPPRARSRSPKKNKCTKNPLPKGDPTPSLIDIPEKQSSRVRTPVKNRHALHTMVFEVEAKSHGAFLTQLLDGTIQPEGLNGAQVSTWISEVQAFMANANQNPRKKNTMMLTATNSLKQNYLKSHHSKRTTLGT